MLLSEDIGGRRTRRYGTDREHRLLVDRVAPVDLQLIGKEIDRRLWLQALGNHTPGSRLDQLELTRGLVVEPDVVGEACAEPGGQKEPLGTRPADPKNAGVTHSRPEPGESASPRLDPRPGDVRDADPVE